MRRPENFRARGYLPADASIAGSTISLGLPVGPYAAKDLGAIVWYPYNGV